jgi:hypothetical protein
MNNKKSYYLLSFISVICLLTACVAKPKSETAGENICIAPLAKFSYNAGSGSPYPDKSIVPPAPWTKEAIIELRTPVLLGSRTLYNDDTELWFYEQAPLGSERNTQNQIYIYRTNEEELNPVDLDESFMNSYYPVDEIFITKDNSIWTTQLTTSYTETPILAKYDESNNKLLPVEKLINITHNSSYATLVLYDQNNNLFWFMVPYGYIYSYDPITDNLEKHISIGEKEIGGAVVMPDGKIYIYALRYEYTIDGAGDALFLYSPTDETLDQVRYYLERNDHAINLYIDKNDRLWMGSNGWMEPDGTWYQTVKSPLFIRANGELLGDHFYHYFPPNIEFETSDGLLWFTGRGGIRGGTYSVDFGNEEWCWVSTSSNTIMDDGGNLWMVVDDKLYKRAVK